MQSLSVNWLFIMLHFKGKHLECSRTLKAYWSDIYRTFINFPYIFKIGKISPVTLEPESRFILGIKLFNWNLNCSDVLLIKRCAKDTAH